MFITVGLMVFQTIFYLSPPLCFTQVLVGVQMVSDAEKCLIDVYG